MAGRYCARRLHHRRAGRCARCPIGLLIGFFVALGKQSQEPSIRLAANIYTTIFRGLPELLTLFLVYFGIQIGLQQLLLLFGVEAKVEINTFVSGMMALGVVFSSYASARSSFPPSAPFRKASMRAATRSGCTMARRCGWSCCRS